ncbi:ATP-binding protein [Flavobacterium sp.]|jgi:predicted AAA+ superfamily ATPase|uniref:ATP-binding protein n=1 Tax=Flavobacterium sp. TaxID=239 RepID=UPI0037BF85B4
MQDYIQRVLLHQLKKYLTVFPAVAILGPRQCGKSTLVKSLDQHFDGLLYLDMQKESDLNKLSEPEIFFASNADKIICLDEIQLVPKLFSVLRSTIDSNRINGKFILLGSASQDLLQHTSESLAGRIGMLHLSPFLMNELNYLESFNLQKFWLRGGFPNSYLADNDENSAIWLENYIRTYIERDIPQLGFQIPALQLRRLLTMCAHNQGQLLNLSKLAESLGLTHPTIKRYIDLLEQTFIVRTIPPFEINIKKRLVKSPKVFLRDSGILHQLLAIPNFNSLLGNPVFGSSWEGMVLENIIVNMPSWDYFFYRTATGDEIDLLLKKGNQVIAIECKASDAPKVTKGFYRSLEVVKPNRTYIIAPTNDTYQLQENITVIGLENFLKLEL